MTTTLSRSTFTGLRCKECGHAYEASARHVCEDVCFGPLEVVYDYEAIRSRVSRATIEAGPASIWRYREFLPVEGDPIDVGTGFTPLLRANNLARRLGLRDLYIKNDGVNMPTLSFKDRVVSVALTRARELGFTTVSCASTGNLANSTAAIAAHAGLDCCVFIPSDLELGKVGYEVIEQLGWRLPDHIVAPLASGSLFTKIRKGFDEFIKVGLVDDKPVRFSGAQAEGCSPIAQAFAEGRDFITPVKPNTIAKSIAIGNPADGPYAIDIANTTGGTIAAVSDAEIVEGIKLLAETEGVFTETAGGTTIAVLRKLVEQGKINPEETTVAYITGNGLKTTEAIADAIGEPYLIDAQLESFRSAWEQARHKHTPG